jgi:hypothetical protein
MEGGWGWGWGWGWRKRRRKKREEVGRMEQKCRDGREDNKPSLSKSKQASRRR